MIRIFWIGVALTLSACATPALQTEALLKNTLDLPPESHISGVEFIQQASYHCGPATLAMAMGWAGNRTSPEALADQVYTPGKKGALQLDMISASRRQGMMAVQIQGMANLMRELAAGNPVIVLQNLFLSWYPYWHYSLVLGYDFTDPDTPTVSMHSGSRNNWSQKMRNFERNWKGGEYWGLVVLPPGKLSATASDLEHSAAAAGIEQAGRAIEAELAYRKILDRWPQSFGALLGMGNITYARGDFRAAVGFLRKATAFHPLSAAAWHNLALAEGSAGNTRKARQSAARALELITPAQAPAYRDSLAQWMLHVGARQ